MLKNIVALAVIFCGAALAWLILGATLVQRTQTSDEAQSAKLSSQWGSPQTQPAPQVTARVAVDTYNADKKRTERGYQDLAVPIRSSRVAVALGLEQRRKGLLWYNLYDVRFRGRYRVRNDTPATKLTLHFPLPSNGGTYTDVTCLIGGHRVSDATALGHGTLSFALQPGQETSVDVGYLSRGMQSWIYSFGDGVQSVDDFGLTMTTDFSAIDYPPNTLLPSATPRPAGKGWRLEWNYGTLVTSNGIGMTVPYPMQPGPLAQRITFWAPIALLFYFFVMFMVSTMRNVELHPMNYFFLACAFFAFHLLFAYLVDRIAIESAFVICSLVSLFLTITYLRLVVGWRFAAVEGGLAQLVYLILFSYALFNEGWSGLTITIGAIVTLFVVMQVTGRVRWADRFARAT
jgi:inner membrane protein involved in colicin E2 resistance